MIHGSVLCPLALFQHCLLMILTDNLSSAPQCSAQTQIKAVQLIGPCLTGQLNSDQKYDKKPAHSFSSLAKSVMITIQRSMHFI